MCDPPILPTYDHFMHITDLAPACDRFAESTGCPVVVEDPDYRVLAFSAVPGQEGDPVRDAAILRRRTPEAWLQWVSQHGDQLSTDSDDLLIVDEPWPGLRRRAVRPLRRDGELVGYLWLLEGSEGFPTALVPALKRFEATLVSALEIPPSGREEARLVRQILDGSLTHERLMTTLGASPEASLILTAYLLPEDIYAPRVEQPRILGAARRPTKTGAQPGCWVALIGSRVVRIDLVAHPVGEIDHAGRLGAARRLQQIVQGAIHAVSSAPVGFGEVAARWADVTLGAATLRSLDPNGRYATFEEMRVAAALHVIDQAVEEHRALFNGLLSPASTPPHWADLVATLRSLLRHEGSISAAAHDLRLHPNSVRYRYERLRQALPTDLDDPSARLALRLATWGGEELSLPGTAL